MKYQTSLCVTLILLSIASFTGASEGTDGVHTALRADDLVVVQFGEKIYQARCASCHGEKLEGQPNWRKRDTNGFLPAPPHDSTGHTWHHADDLLFEITKFGPSVVIADTEYMTMMPVYKDILSDEEIVAVLSFIKNTWPEEQRLWQEEINGTQWDGFSSSSKKDSSVIENIINK